MGLLVLLPFAIFSEGGQLFTALTSPGFDAVRFLSIMFLNGTMYTAYNQFSFMVLSRVSTATHAVLNVCRRVCVIAATTMFFATPLSVMNMVGILVAVAGMFCFTHAKSAAAKKTT